jgi:NTP pyrophosphatase (non-canonical NTP hydrolase)
MKTLDECQEEVKRFDIDRNWNYFYPLEIFANINEEIGEIWQRIAWVSDEKKKELIKKHHREIEDNIGDLLFLIFKLSNQLDVACGKGFANVMAEYIERFPLEKFQNDDKDSNTANKDLGYDAKATRNS